jgi:hypothetical protein
MRVIAIIALAAFLVLLFYFLPRALDKMRAQRQDPLEIFWWGKIGPFTGRQVIVALILFAALFSLAIFLVGIPDH